jgi:hypothetical protein
MTFTVGRTFCEIITAKSGSLKIRADLALAAVLLDEIGVAVESFGSGVRAISQLSLPAYASSRFAALA